MNRHKKDIKINIGSGRAYLSGFINIEGNIVSKKNIFLDIRVGLPYPRESVKFIYASHFLEHFYFDELQAILREIYRVLCFGGVFRIVVPDLEQAILHYANKNDAFFSEFPRGFASTGGKFVNFIFCDGQHKTAFDFSFIRELLLQAGFSKNNIEKLSASESVYLDKHDFDQLRSIEELNAINSLFVEARK
jgi:predicted SAM-dependent methyltransferase